MELEIKVKLSVKAKRIGIIFSKKEIRGEKIVVIKKK